MIIKEKLTAEDFEDIKNNKELLAKIKENNISYHKVIEALSYYNELRLLQIELVKLQRHISNENMRVAVIFEGRDAAGKGGNIRRFMEHLNPRSSRLVALNKPTEVEKGQWYFQRYIKELPNPGEIVFFDRSWYNRAVVEPVMGFCTDKQYKDFLVQVPEFEHMMYEDGVVIIKFWLSITKDEQLKRFEGRKENQLKRWKFSPVDKQGQILWDKYTHYKAEMFSKTHTTYSPWMIIKTNDKKVARLESMRHVLSHFYYEGKTEAGTILTPDPNVAMRYFRSNIHQID
ncbi:MAG: polyphosphate kinase 2 [Flavobacteriia bacterium]|nr:polyphosphate kinase 2 [Flavobacteriia bacterium]OIP45857.1 MAG: polyphosphate kinase 2 [Flavobacteriaceae bacterium CG2_30_31_66]PIV97760.1 MAG: polyphosphate kinase 2 [Flavobacteriaceae bacterium CG17_big_fil_post_rev_8_21_14_2_50_31_13]PIY15153.1 MAG: polyphosphate kinase 2 [Flavobacteriaceae bacterium CG_4_10_14_3_um_filter_31_253]PIZ09479.1 MAG: polyphosphate kinase 2 [Flavobacteriaceae bacterium CG_4_10_14_0_8_um_filter_31_99]PJC10038.1 MAG: polyphosphate kinase 2 [Flavobacteriaceae b